ncbi:hypothetical protein PC121_g2454 [Phytophthora cactorum]|nr:hypothetical protein PC121_g2454 [Phytophthora cactorum]
MQATVLHSDQASSQDIPRTIHQMLIMLDAVSEQISTMAVMETWRKRRGYIENSSNNTRCNRRWSDKLRKSGSKSSRLSDVRKRKIDERWNDLKKINVDNELNKSDFKKKSVGRQN